MAVAPVSAASSYSEYQTPIGGPVVPVVTARMTGRLPAHTKESGSSRRASRPVTGSRWTSSQLIVAGLSFCSANSRE